VTRCRRFSLRVERLTANSARFVVAVEIEERPVRTVDYRNLQNIVDASDAAIRVASQLRQIESGRRVGLMDADAIGYATTFLEQASSGGSFMAGQSAAQANFSTTLQPLNWAVDTLLSVKDQRAEKQDYGAIARYLEQIVTTLKGVAKGGRTDPQRVSEARAFFDSLGELLASRADQSMRRESLQFDVALGI
jgi:hypothetical protein